MHVVDDGSQVTFRRAAETAASRQWDTDPPNEIKLDAVSPVALSSLLDCMVPAKGNPNS
jgi:hypothetical protein